MAGSSDLLIGAHTSAAGGVHKALLEGKKIGATTIQLFTSNQKRWRGKPISEEEVHHWEKMIEETGMRKVMSHDSYLINLGSPDSELLHKSLRAFQEELERCQILHLSFLNFHPGAFTSCTPELCLETIVESLLSIEEVAAKDTTRLLLENTAGQGSSIGFQFEHLGYIIERVEKRIPIGVCLDTCHLFAAGYDIRTQEAWDFMLQEFDRKVGLRHLFALHVNDSVKEWKSRVDRHASLGEGKIGIDAFQIMMRHPLLREIPKYLETPGGPSIWEKEIAMLREFAG